MTDISSPHLCMILPPKTKTVCCPVKINGKFTSVGLIDPGSTEYFITAAVAENQNLVVMNIKSNICLAYGSDFHINGYTDTTIEIEI